MEPITTAVEEVTIDSNRIIHETKVDFISRNIPNVVRLVQYDMTLPIISVALHQAGVRYALPTGAACNIRLKKPDGTVVYNPAYGCDSTRTVVYFVVSAQMTVVSGETNPVIEVLVNGRLAGSSPLRIVVEENPVKEDDIVSEDEVQAIIAYVEQASEARDEAVESSESAEAWAVGKIDGTDVPSTATQYHNNAKYYAEQAVSSATTASTASTNASTSASQASTSATSAGNSATSASGSASSASTSAQTATTQATKAQSYAVGGTSSRTGEDTDNAKYYKEQAEASAAMLDAEKILGNFASYEETTTASKAYKVGEFLTYNGYLYRVTTAIASGGTITVGTNVVQTTVGDELSNMVLRFEGITVSALTGDIATVTDSRITADHVVAECVWGNPSYITTDVTATTSAGSLVLNGTCTTATTVTITLVKKMN